MFLRISYDPVPAYKAVVINARIFLFQALNIFRGERGVVVDMEKHSEQIIGQIFIFQVFRKQPVRRNIGVCRRDQLCAGLGQTRQKHSEKILGEQRQLNLDFPYFMGDLGGEPTERLFIYDVREVAPDAEAQLFIAVQCASNPQAFCL